MLEPAATGFIGNNRLRELSICRASCNVPPTSGANANWREEHMRDHVTNAGHSALDDRAMLACAMSQLGEAWLHLRGWAKVVLGHRAEGVFRGIFSVCQQIMLKHEHPCC